MIAVSDRATSPTPDRTVPKAVENGNSEAVPQEHPPPLP